MRHAIVGTVLATVLGGCAGSGEPSSEPAPSAAPSVSPAESSAAESSAAGSPSGDAFPGGLDMTCDDSGGPTVVLVPGLGADRTVFDELAGVLPDSVRVCQTERAGVGTSPALPGDAPDPTAGSAADQLLEALQARGVSGPYVLLGWSYGGMVVQAFVDRHPRDVAGVVLEDASVPEEFTEPFWRRQSIDWAEGGRSIDTRGTARELAHLDFGDVPLFVLTQGEPTGEFRRNWFGHQDFLASLSSDSVHVVADQSGHEIHRDALPLVRAAVTEVVSAVGSGSPLRPCDGRFARLDGSCRG
ncbi:MAG: alpha/beta fold hydrolase [Nocardioidaceae bacterium]